MSRATNEERETVIRYDQTPEEANVWTCDPALMRRLEARGVKPSRVEKDGGRVFAKEYRVPKRWVKISPPRQVSESQREAARRTLQTLHGTR